MKFRNETLVLGMRFYKFESDDEYRILALVKLNDNESAVFMDEETFETYTITKDELEKEYTLLSDSFPFIIVKFDGDPRFFFYKSNELISDYRIQSKLSINVYQYMRKTVFVKMLNNIVHLNNLYKSLANDNNLDIIWRTYFSYMRKSTYVDTIKEKDNIDMEAIVNNEAKLPDSVFAKAEEYLNTYIFSYEVYKFDPSVNIYNINMKYFFMYDSIIDEYYIVLYVIDTTKVAMETIKMLEENKDIIQFMLE